jgi:hypothetical protein
MDLIDFLNENYYMLVPALWVIGYALKQTPKIPDWTIIWILLVLSLGIGTFAFGFSINGVVNGVIAAGVAVLGHQMFKQTIGSRMVKRKVVTIEEEKVAGTDVQKKKKQK